jgi:hypothetical protein
MSFSNVLELETLDHIFGGNTAGNVYTPPTKLYIAASTALVADDGTGLTEPTDSAYARVEVDNTASTWYPSANGAKRNRIAFTFPAATMDWGKIIAIVIMTAPASGSLLARGKLHPGRNIGYNDVLEIPVNGVTISIN